MRKFVAMAAPALLLAACSQQEAWAWINAKFGVGLNWSYQSGGNNLAWGVFRNGQPPCPDGPGYYGPGYGAPDYFHAQGYQGHPYAQGTETAPVPTPAAGPASPGTRPTSSLDYPGYQPVSYPMYYQPSYFIPGNYGQ
jgi:hypothetical protein